MELTSCQKAFSSICRGAASGFAGSHFGFGTVMEVDLISRFISAFPICKHTIKNNQCIPLLTLSPRVQQDMRAHLLKWARSCAS